MSRKSKKLKEFQDIFDQKEIVFLDNENIDILKNLRDEMSKISDTRHESYVRHSLCDIIIITLLAVLSNADEWSEIEIFAKSKEKWLRKFLKLENGIPSDDTFRTVISNLNINYLYGIIINFFIEKVNEVIETFTDNKERSKEKNIISCDGKASCATGRKETDKPGSKMLHTLNAYSSDYGFCLAQEFVDEKTNEITSMPLLLKQLDLRNTIVTWDALNTQKEIVKEVINGHGDYVGALKGNQHNFYKDVKDFFDEDMKMELKKEKTNYKKTIEKEHSGIVTREYYVCDDIKWLYNKENWAGLKAIGMEFKTIEKNNSKIPITYETRYFICSITDIEEYSQAVRNHWGVENGLHWHLDFTFKDDKNTTMKENGAKGLQIFKKVSLAILKMVQAIYPKRTSLKLIRYRLSLSFNEEIERIFTSLDVNKLNELKK